MTDIVRVKIEEARKALQQAYSDGDLLAVYFWTGYLLALE